MMKLIIFCLSIHVLLEQTSAVPVDNCGEAFQSQLRELVATKQSCDSAAFYDCCQIKQIVPKAPTDCYSVYDFAYNQSPFREPTTLAARCDMETDGGGWMVIQRRVPDGTLDFVRNWSDYENGFGDLEGEFWYGLRNIHHLTTRDDVELRIDMVWENDGTEFSWTYQTFRVAGDTDNYRLTIGEGEGLDDDAMAYHNNHQFSTYDFDNDNRGNNCAFIMQGGWWYNGCYHANLNGPHTVPSVSGVDETYALLLWNDGNDFRNISSVEMKIRVKQCIPLAETC